MSMASNVEVIIKPLQALSGQKYLDEITGLPATLQAVIGGVPYYYQSIANHRLDYESILLQVAPLMSEVHSLSGGAGAVERSIMQKRLARLHSQMAEICERVATANVANKHYELAVPAALRCLRAMRAIHGEGTLPLVTPYLLLAEAELGVGRAPQAEEFLASANFILVKHLEAPQTLRARMHRDFGRVYSAQGNHAAALDHFAKDVMCNTLALGPDAIATSIGYFFMAQVFAAQANLPAATAMFDRVCECWYRHLLGARSGSALALGLDWTAASPGQRLERIAARQASDAAAAASGKPALTAEGEAEKLAAAAAASTTQGGLASGSGYGGAAAATTAAASYMSPDCRLTDQEAAEGVEVLSFVAQARASRLGPTHVACAEVLYTLALLHLDGYRDPDEARRLLRQVESIFLARCGPDYPTLFDVRALLHTLDAAATAASSPARTAPGTAVTARLRTSSRSPPRY